MLQRLSVFSRCKEMALPLQPFAQTGKEPVLVTEEAETDVQSSHPLPQLRQKIMAPSLLHSWSSLGF